MLVPALPACAETVCCLRSIVLVVPQFVIGRGGGWRLGRRRAVSQNTMRPDFCTSGVRALCRGHCLVFLCRIVSSLCPARCSRCGTRAGCDCAGRNSQGQYWSTLCELPFLGAERASREGPARCRRRCRRQWEQQGAQRHGEHRGSVNSLRRGSGCSARAQRARAGCGGSRAAAPPRPLAAHLEGTGALLGSRFRDTNPSEGDSRWRWLPFKPPWLDSKSSPRPFIMPS